MRASETQDDRSRTSTDRYRDRSSDLNSDPDLVTEQFEEFYKAYPRRQAKQDAEEAWRKLNPNEQLFSRILTDIRHRFRTIELKFVPSPATYLRGARWNDEVIADKPKPETPIDVSKRLIHEAEVEAHGESRGTQTGSDVGSRVSGTKATEETLRLYAGSLEQLDYSVTCEVLKEIIESPREFAPPVSKIVSIVRARMEIAERDRRLALPRKYQPGEIRYDPKGRR